MCLCLNCTNEYPIKVGGNQMITHMCMLTKASLLIMVNVVVV